MEYPQLKDKLLFESSVDPIEIVKRREGSSLMQCSVFFLFSKKSRHPVQKKPHLLQAKNLKVCRQKLVLLLNQIKCMMV